MGLLVDGIWQDQGYDTSKTDGRFERSRSQFRHWVTPDGSEGPTGDAGFKAEPGRYHLYVSYACPWAHRTLIMRQLKGLEKQIDFSVVHWLMGSKGWTFEEDGPAMGDQLFASRYMHQIYTRADPVYSGRVTVPVLWDKQRGTIVSNESAEIIRMFNSAFAGAGGNERDFWPKAHRDEIEMVNNRVYDTVNNGVYRAGFATTAVAYEEAARSLFESLDWLELRLRGRRWLVGEAMSEADIRLFTTLVRFDSVYFGHFKCNLRRLSDYPNLWNYTKEIYQTGTIASTVNMDHIKKHYYASHESINPTRIVPIGPELDFSAPHDRERFASPAQQTA